MRTISKGRIRTADAPKFFEADGGQTLSVRLKDGFGRRTLKMFSKRMEADGGRTSSVRLKDEFGRRTG